MRARPSARGTSFGLGHPAVWVMDMNWLTEKIVFLCAVAGDARLLPI
jgi:hypothetical protein